MIFNDNTRAIVHIQQKYIRAVRKKSEKQKNTEHATCKVTHVSEFAHCYFAFPIVCMRQHEIIFFVFKCFFFRLSEMISIAGHTAYVCSVYVNGWHILSPRYCRRWTRNVNFSRFEMRMGLFFPYIYSFTDLFSCSLLFCSFLILSDRRMKEPNIKVEQQQQTDIPFNEWAREKELFICAAATNGSEAHVFGLLSNGKLFPLNFCALHGVIKSKYNCGTVRKRLDFFVRTLCRAFRTQKKKGEII